VPVQFIEIIKENWSGAELHRLSFLVLEPFRCLYGAIHKKSLWIGKWNL